MKKIWLLTLASMLVLAGCGSGSGVTTTPVAQQEPMQAGVVMVKQLMDVAMVGQIYNNTVGVVPNDRRNEIVSLSIINPTTGGAQPSIDSTGLVTWIANDADFASTKVLRVTTKLKEGADVTVDTPVVVRNERLVYEVTLEPDEASYSDPEGRYLVRIKRLNPALPIAGTLKIVEVFQASGYFVPEYRIANESNTDLVVIEQPISQPLAPTSGLTTQAAPYPLLARPFFSIPFPWEIGAAVFSGVNVYSSRGQYQYPTRNILGETIYKNSEAPQVFSFLASCDSAQTCRATSQSPVILIHGFTLSGLGGGEGTWGKLPDALIAAGHPVFEMQWNTYMRFEEAAGTLAKFGQAVAILTGEKPIIIAHSFGGIVSHLALQGQGIEFTGSTWQPVNVMPNDVFSQLITLDSPLSGISDSAQPNVPVSSIVGATHNFTYGRDDTDITINACTSITCLQAGAFDMNLIERIELKLNLSRIDPSLNASNAIFPGESIVRIQQNQTTVPFLTVVGTNLIPKQVNILANSAYRLGDGLISLMGQSVNPFDFAKDPYNTAKESIQMRVAGGEILDLNELNLLETGKDCRKKDINGRKYWICARASHNALKQKTFVDDYGIANFQAPVEGGGIHPLRTLIDTALIAKSPTTSAPAITMPVSAVRGSVVANNSSGLATPVVNLSIRVSLIEKSTGHEKKVIDTSTSQNGVFNIDVGNLLVAAVGANGDLNIGHYALDLKMGDGLSTRIWTKHIDFMLPLINLGEIDLTLSTGLVNISGTVIDGQTISTPIAGADVWLSQGVDQTAERLRLLSNNNVARKVTTDQFGQFSVTGLRPGNYSALVSKAGYSDQLQGSVTVAANGSLSFSLLRVLNPGEAAITLRWASAAGGLLVSSDLDSHLIRLNSLGTVDYHIYYANKTVFGLPDSLDRDDTDYEGPETITLALTSGMNYTYYVHNFSSFGTLPGSYPRVTLNLGSSVQQFDLPLAVNTAGSYWRVFDIVNGQVNRCLTNCLQDIAPSGLQTQASSAILMPQLFRAVFENLPAKQ